MCYKLRDKINTLDLINRWFPFYCGSLGVKVRNDSYSRSRWFEKKEISNTAISFSPSLSLQLHSSPILWSSSVRCSPDRTDASYW